MNSPLIIITPLDLDFLITQSVGKAVKEALSSLESLSSSEIKPELLTRKEACKALKISLPTLGDWTRRNLLKSYTIGGRIYYKSDELEKALKQIP